MPIANQPAAAALTNEALRPLAEKLRAARAEILDLKARWYGGANLNLPWQEPDEIILDKGGTDTRNATGEGYCQVLTSGDANNLMGQLLPLVDGSGAYTGLNAEILEKFCVRPLKAT